MNGLMVKDWMLLKRQGRYFMIVIVLSCVMAYTGSENFSSFLTSYMTFMITIFTFSSFSYDEYDNGMAYLMALPSGRRNYVKEKYLFSILLISCVWLLGCLLRLLLFVIRFSAADYLKLLPLEPVYLLICLIYAGAAIPIILKYGAERGRNMVFMILAILVMGVFAIARFRFPVFPMLTSVLKQIDRWSETAPVMLLIPLLAVCILTLGISYLFSVRIMEKKEF